MKFTRSRLAPFLLTLTLAGCTSVEVSYRTLVDPGESPDKGSMQIKALRQEQPEKYARGYLFTLTRNTSFSKTYESSPSGPIAIDDLDVGHYRLVITGKYINPLTTDLAVQPGQRTDVLLRVRDARRDANLGAAAEVSGKVFLYAAAGAVYATIWVANCMLTSWLEGSDDECLFCGQTSCSCRPAGDRKKSKGKK